MIFQDLFSSMDLLSTTILFIQFLIDLLILVKIIREFTKSRLTTLIYFMWSFGMFVVADFLIFLFSVRNIRGFMAEVFLLPANSMFSMVGYFLLLLFFTTFDEENVLTRKNVILGVLIAMVISSTYSNSFMISLLYEEHFQGFTSITQFDPDNLTNTVLFLLMGFYLNIIAIFGLVILQFIMIARLINKKMKRAKNPVVQKIMKRMHRHVYLILFGIFLSGVSIIGNLLVLIGFFMIFWIYLNSGIHIFQEEGLRRLMIIDNAGLPLYSYLFSGFEGKEMSDQQFENEEMMFSGALKAISSLFAELTGANQTLKEIILDKIVLLVQLSPTKDKIVILFCDRATKFHREAIEHFTDTLFKEVPVWLENLRISGENETRIINLIDNYFGLRNKNMKKVFDRNI